MGYSRLNHTIVRLNNGKRDPRVPTIRCRNKVPTRKVNNYRQALQLLVELPEEVVMNYFRRLRCNLFVQAYVSQTRLGRMAQYDVKRLNAAQFFVDSINDFIREYNGSSRACTQGEQKREQQEAT